MKIKHGMILAAGLGKRMQPITLKTPKPLIQIGNKNLLERAIELLINHGIEEIAINVHHLPDQIKDFINKKKYKAKIIISDEQDMLLDTGGGILQATKSFKKPFVAINPDTLWNDAYCNELKDLENLYFQKKKPCLLLVNKNLSFDKAMLFGCAIPTGAGMMMNQIKPSTEDSVLILGLGGIGLSALIMSLALGVKKIAVIELRSETRSYFPFSNSFSTRLILANGSF